MKHLFLKEKAAGTDEGFEDKSDAMEQFNGATMEESADTARRTQPPSLKTPSW